MNSEVRCEQLHKPIVVKGMGSEILLLFVKCLSLGFWTSTNQTHQSELVDSRSYTIDELFVRGCYHSEAIVSQHAPQLRNGQTRVGDPPKHVIADNSIEGRVVKGQCLRMSLDDLHVVAEAFVCGVDEVFLDFCPDPACRAAIAQDLSFSATHFQQAVMVSEVEEPMYLTSCLTSYEACELASVG